MTFTGRISLHPGGTTGVTTGTLTIRDSARRMRMRATVNGVITERSEVNGNVVGTVYDPTARLLANLTMVFDDQLSFAVRQARARNGEELGDRVSGDPEVPLARRGRKLLTHAR